MGTGGAWGEGRFARGLGVGDWGLGLKKTRKESAERASREPASTWHAVAGLGRPRPAAQNT